MKVAITGATGLIGRALTTSLISDGHEVIALSRTAGTVGDVTTTVWDASTSALPRSAFEGVDAFVNLAGAGIGDGRWGEAHRRAIIDSRITTTRRLVEAMRRDGPSTLINGSAIGFYGPGDDEKDETAGPGDDFLADVCVRWEAEASRAPDAARVVLLRTGVVFSAHGGALPKLVRPARVGAGGPLGGGRQWQSWIHIDDEVGIIRHALANPLMTGPVNATAPQPVRQAELAALLGRILRRPAKLPTPAFAIRLLLGGAADIVLTGQRVLPVAALFSGYRFTHPALEPVLRALLGKGREPVPSGFQGAEILRSDR
jgi:uncharacterized protein (TIGR01777 family)